MIEIHERVFVANELACTRGNSGLAIVHACKSPCHQRGIGYSGSLPKTHPNYLVLEQDYDLFLNIIDPPVPLFIPQLFTSFLSFATKHWEEGKRLLIHCNQGESRAPSMALLFLAKGLSAINKSSYQAARKEFETLYPQYNPGRGIETYFTQNWSILGERQE
jgi:hypothetical protein